MSRGFGATRGVGSTDAIAASVNLTPTARVAAFAFALRNGAGGGGFGRIVEIGVGNCAFYFDTGTTEFVFQYIWSGGTALWRAAAPSSGVFHSVGFDYDPSSTANDPLIYIDGASVTVTEQTAPTGTAVADSSTALRIGNRGGGDRGWDGDLARVAWWRGGSPTGVEFASMHGGTAPSSIQSGTLIYYNSLSGGTTPSVGSNVSVTGTADQADPTFDTTDPVLTSPTGTGGSLVCSGGVTTDEGNGTLYAVATASATSPSAAQVKAGQDHTGAAALRAVSQAVSSTGAQTVASGAVTAGTRYLHYMHEDAATNQSTVSSSASFTVTAGGATLTSSAIKNNTGTLQLSAAAEAYVSNPTTGALVLKKTGLTSHATTGVITFSDAALAAATSYRVVWVLTATGAEGLETLTAT